MGAGRSLSEIEHNSPWPGASLELGETRRLREAERMDRALLWNTPVDRVGRAGLFGGTCGLSTGDRGAMAPEVEPLARFE